MQDSMLLYTHTRTHTNRHGETESTALHPQAASPKCNQTKSSPLTHTRLIQYTHIDAHTHRGIPQTVHKHASNTAHTQSRMLTHTHTADHSMQASEEIY